MRKTLKTLGFAAIAALALSAMSAASAPAQEQGQITGPEQFTLIGEQDPAGTNGITAFGQSPMHCPETVYTGHKADTTPHTDITSGDTEITITPHIAGCVLGGDPRTFDVRDCDYVYRDFTTTGGSGTYGFLTDVECDETSGILMTGGTCTVTIPPQTGLTGLHATNEAGLIRIHGTLTSLTMSACDGLLHTSEAEWHQDIVMTDTEGEGVSISD